MKSGGERNRARLTTFGLALLCASAFLGACASALPEPTSQDADFARTSYRDVSVEQLAQGRSIYVSRCAGCHVLKLPREVPAERWRHEVDEMRQKRGVALTAAEAESIVRYLETVSRESGG
jgi:hypothetical protein